MMTQNLQGKGVSECPPEGRSFEVRSENAARLMLKGGHELAAQKGCFGYRDQPLTHT